jgi:hypothetical protein
MQLRGWELTRASRIVIILLVVQHLGLGQLLVVAPASAAEPDPADPSWTVVSPDAVLPHAVVVDPASRASTAIRGHGSPPIPRDPGPLSRRLPRAPPG